jgi:mannitol-1-/sugar-/sorbitol-6-phosphatase
MSFVTETVVLRAKGILFDMDGILISSIGSVERSWHAWATKNGVDPELAIRTAHGRRAIETITKLRPDLDGDAELKWIEDLEIEDQEGTVALPGVLELLASLPEGRWTVVTSATGKLARVRLRTGGIEAPEVFVSADSVAEGKPSPAPFLKGAEVLGFRPEDCVVFEDSGAGVRAGHAAGCRVVATTFSHPVEELAKAEFLITDMTQVRVTADGDGLRIELRPEGKY